MVTTDGSVVLAHVGMQSLEIMAPNGTVRTSHALAFKAPEELHPPGDPEADTMLQTMATDVYSFATTSYAVGSAPYRYCSGPTI